MKSGRQKVRIEPKWAQRQPNLEARKSLVRNGGYILAPLRRVLGGREMTGCGLETGTELRRVPERCQPLGKWGLDLLPNLLPNFEKHGKHGIHGKVMVNEGISLR